MAKKLRTFELTVTDVLNDQPAVTYTALVDEPAIESYVMMFGKSVEPFAFKIANEERRIITGAAMIPDLPIYRNDTRMGEYNVVFSKETIETIMKKWAKAGYHNNVNIMHNPDQKPDGVYLVESFLVDKTRGIKAPTVLKEDFPDGTWIKSYYIENDEVWSGFKSGKYKGLSEEGMFNMDVREFRRDEEQLLTALSNLAKIL